VFPSPKVTTALLSVIGIKSAYRHSPVAVLLKLSLVMISLAASTSSKNSIRPPHPSFGGTSSMVYSRPHFEHLIVEYRCVIVSGNEDVIQDM